MLAHANLSKTCAPRRSLVRSLHATSAVDLGWQASMQHYAPGLSGPIMTSIQDEGETQGRLKE